MYFDNIKVRISADMAMGNLSLRCTSTVGWKPAQIMLTVHSVAPSFVSISQYVSPCTLHVPLLNFCLSSHSIRGWETEKGGNVRVRPGPAGLFWAPAAGTEQHRTGGQSVCETEHKSVLQNCSYRVMEQWQYLNSVFLLCPSVFQVTVYMLSGVGAALLLILLFTVWSSIRKRQKPEARQACDAQINSEQSQ